MENLCAFLVNPTVFPSDSLLVVLKPVFLLPLVSECLKAVGVLLLLFSSVLGSFSSGKPDDSSQTQ